jgi:hypothetical protein
MDTDKKGPADYISVFIGVHLWLIIFSAVAVLASSCPQSSCHFLVPAEGRAGWS